MSQIKVTVKFFTSLRAITGEREKTLFLPEDSNMDYLLKDLKNQYPELAKKIDYSFIVLNEEYPLKYTPLQEGDVIAIIPPAS